MALLKQRTSETHRRVERLVDLLDPALTLARLTDVLVRFHGFWQPTERAIDAWARATPALAEQLAWTRRRRGAHLRADLAALGADPACAPQSVPVFHDATDADVLGWLYVSEGSTLGGAVISRRLAPLLAGTTLTSFAPFAEGPGPMWRAYRDVVTDWVGSDGARAEDVVRTAESTFAALADWLAPLAGERAA